jgi:DNA-directed RNA polymerase specialized sigma24 family protein
MDLESALGELPEAHAVALRLYRAGADTPRIASELGIDIDAVGPLLRVAQAKLARVLTPEDSVDRDNVTRPHSAPTSLTHPTPPPQGPVP